MIRIAVCGLVLLAAPVDAQRRAQGPIRLAEVGEIGCPSCSDFRLLNNVLGVTIRGRDSVYVLDAARPKVRAFRYNGRRISSHVSEGRNLGQVVLPIGLVTAGDGAILVDGVLDRVTVYRPDWSPVGDFVLARKPVAVAHRAPVSHFFIATVNYEGSATTPVVEIWRGSTADTTMRVVRTFNDRFPRSSRGTITSFFSFAMSPDGGFAVGEGAYAYRVRLFTEDGTFVREIERDVPRTAMTERERSRAQERRRMALRRASSTARTFGGNPGPLDDVDEEWNHFSATALRFDDAGRLWVKTDRGGERETIFDVFTVEGTLYTEVRVPLPIGHYDIRDRHLAGLTMYPMEVPIVKVYEINERAAGNRR